jgi:hypothetical protein
MTDFSSVLSKLSSGNFLGAVVDKVTVYSEYTAPTTYSPQAVQGGNTPGGATTQSQGVSPWGLLFKPTIVIDSPLSPQPYIFAPYGVADPEAYKSKQFALVWGPLAVLGLVGGAAYFLGRASGKASRR